MLQFQSPIERGKYETYVVLYFIRKPKGIEYRLTQNSVLRETPASKIRVRKTGD